MASKKYTANIIITRREQTRGFSSGQRGKGKGQFRGWVYELQTYVSKKATRTYSTRNIAQLFYNNCKWIEGFLAQLVKNPCNAGDPEVGFLDQEVYLENR